MINQKWFGYVNQQWVDINTWVFSLIPSNVLGKINHGTNEQWITVFIILSHW